MLVNQDCMEAMKSLDANGIDALITDPPAGISFMNKEWDSDKGGRDGWIAWMTEVMSEAMRVMKPGAHGLVWAIPRTSHWTGTALELAGFEIRDFITHHFGSGFPKSLNINKALSKDGRVCTCGQEEISSVPDLQERIRASDTHADSETENLRLQMPRHSSQGSQHAKQSDRESTAIPEQRGSQTCGSCGKKIIPEGLGTALKPSTEIWWLVRKPCSEKTVAANVLKWGTGGINIDGCRIGTDIISTHGGGDKLSGLKGNGNAGVGEYKTHTGRFPANLLFDEEAAEMLDEQSGPTKGGGKTLVKTETEQMFGMKGHVNIDYADSGGPSRFFYVAKASKRERGEGNGHPTVKALKLMEYLITLITPPNGVVLDPFMGSGSTGVAAKALGFKFVGIEKEKEYFEIAEKRIG